MNMHTTSIRDAHAGRIKPYRNDNENYTVKPLSFVEKAVRDAQTDVKQPYAKKERLRGFAWFQESGSTTQIGSQKVRV